MATVQVGSDDLTVSVNVVAGLLLETECGVSGFCFGMYLSDGFSGEVRSDSTFDKPKMFDKFDLELLNR